jgi:ribose-phosphate pyrophosphokinase
MMDVAVFSLRDAAESAQRLAEALGVPHSPLAVHRFPDGEIKVTAAPAASLGIFYAPLNQPNDKLLALLFASEALRRQGARRLVLVAPYMCYMRQDAPFQPGEAVSQRVIGKLLAGAYDRVITVDAHLHRIKNIKDMFPGIEADDLSAVPAIAEALAPLVTNAQTLIAGPDEESEAWVRDLGGRLDLSYIVGRKTRHTDRHVDVVFEDPQRCTGKNVILLDDMISSGGTILACANTLRAAGASNVDVVVTHALFNEATANAFTAAGIRSIRSSDSVPHATNAIPLTATLAQALQQELHICSSAAVLDRE